MYAGREVFANSPLEYVAAEIRYPYAPRLRQQDIRDSILLELENLFPILRSQPQLTVTGIVGGPLNQQLDQITRAFNRASTAAVGITPSNLTIDTTAYEDFAQFREIVSRCLAAIDKHASPAAIERIGLRYVNEIRVPVAIADARDWHGWVSDSLIAAATVVPDLKVTTLQGAIQYETGTDLVLTFRFASALSGAMIGNEPLKRRHPAPNGPFLALDLDSFWQPPAEASPDWNLDTIMETIDLLHAPIGSAFQAAITDKLRETVLRTADREL